MGRRIEARKGDNPAGSKPSSRCVEANDGLRVLTKRNPTALTSTDHQMVINGNYLPLDPCLPVTKRVIRYMQISQSLERAMSAATRAAFHVSRQTLQKVSCYRRPRVYHRHFRGAPQSPFGSYDRRIGAAGSSVPRDAPPASRIAEFIVSASASSRVAARVEFVRPEEEPIGSSEGGYSDATRDGSTSTIVHVDPR